MKIHASVHHLCVRALGKKNLYFESCALRLLEIRTQLG
jgi:hypothetical protein